MNNTPNIYTDIARLRWPGFSIYGNGPIAVFHLCDGQKIIRLCEMPMEAEPLIANRCGKRCLHSCVPEQKLHRSIILSATPAPRRVFRKPSWAKEVLA